MQRSKWSKKSFHWRCARLFGNLPVTWETISTPETAERIASGDTYGLPREPVYYGTLCDYIPHVVVGFIRYMAVVFAMTVILSLVTAFLAYCAASLTTWNFSIEMGLGAKIGACILAAIVLIFAVIIGILLVADWKRKRDEAKELEAINNPQSIEYTKPKQPSFLYECWQKFKNKTCIRIEVR